ncbi:hypothetical protein NW768_009496 [Fusarium equiseti]|uniref:Uncharacterized protein n=1 Tax=Fusarium equiseti TaxID=61235 RepID=A0ABQ8R2B1_FUSEQ|nr:hypothetical protein NW768_009496 [Fusarium equiseti]
MNKTATVPDFKHFLSGVFYGWNLSYPIKQADLLPAHKFEHERVKVGVLSQDHSLSVQQLRASVTPDGQKRERRAGQPVYFGLGLNYEAGVVDWVWRDAENAVISPHYVRLEDGETNTTVRTQAMLRYDNVERDRI